MIIENEKFGVNLNTNELKLNSADELVNDIYKEYCKYSKLLELAKKDRIEVIKDTVRYMYYSEKLLISAQSWIHMREDKSLDKRKKYKEKEDFEYLQSILRKEILDDNTVNIMSIFFEGWDKYLCEIEFKILNSDFTTFRLSIPNLSELKEKWWTNMHGGKLTLFASKGDNVWDCLVESYKEEDIAKGLIKYFLS
jgi:hypothetical protein